MTWNSQVIATQDRIPFELAPAGGFAAEAGHAYVVVDAGPVLFPGAASPVPPANGDKAYFQANNGDFTSLGTVWGDANLPNINQNVAGLPADVPIEFVYTAADDTWTAAVADPLIFDYQDVVRNRAYDGGLTSTISANTTLHQLHDVIILNAANATDRIVITRQPNANYQEGKEYIFESVQGVADMAAFGLPDIPSGRSMHIQLDRANDIWNAVGGDWNSLPASTVIDTFDPASPPPIGNVTPNEGFFTDLKADFLQNAILSQQSVIAGDTGPAIDAIFERLIGAESKYTITLNNAVNAGGGAFNGSTTAGAHRVNPGQTGSIEVDFTPMFEDFPGAAIVADAPGGFRLSGGKLILYLNAPTAADLLVEVYTRGTGVDAWTQAYNQNLSGGANRLVIELPNLSWFKRIRFGVTNPGTGLFQIIYAALFPALPNTAFGDATYYPRRFGLDAAENQRLYTGFSMRRGNGTPTVISPEGLSISGGPNLGRLLTGTKPVSDGSIDVPGALVGDFAIVSQQDGGASTVGRIATDGTVEHSALSGAVDALVFGVA